MFAMSRGEGSTYFNHIDIIKGIYNTEFVERRQKGEVETQKSRLELGKDMAVET